MRHVILKLSVAAFAAGLVAFSGPANAVPSAPLKQLAGSVTAVEKAGYRYRRYGYRRGYRPYYRRYRPYYRSYRPYYRYRRPYYGYRYRRPYRRYYRYGYRRRW